MPKKIRILIISILVCVFVYSAGRLIYQQYDAKRSEKQYNDIISMLENNEIEGEKVVEVPVSASKKYTLVREMNKHFQAWLTIDGTRVNYPVVCTPGDEEYYLRRGFDGKYAYSGTPFMAAESDVNTSTNVIVYAHNMKDGSMFSDLLKYTSKDYYDQHKYIHFDTVNEYRLYEIIAAFKTVVYTDNDFMYYSFINQTDANSFNDFISGCKSLCSYNTGVSAVAGDKLLTLSTCEYSQENGRMVIVAKMIASNEMPISIEDLQ